MTRCEEHYKADRRRNRTMQAYTYTIIERDGFDFSLHIVDVATGEVTDVFDYLVTREDAEYLGKELMDELNV